eukprot:4143320-Pleurochrysis_carterae.AAC.2
MSVSKGCHPDSSRRGESSFTRLARSACNSQQQIKPAEDAHVFNMCEQNAESTVPVGDQEPSFEGL